MATSVHEVLSQPFLLVQIGDYGDAEYESQPLPSDLIAIALERQQRGEPSYPISVQLPPPHFRVPTDLRGILMLKCDERRLNGIAYWAQSLRTFLKKGACINSCREELARFAKSTNRFYAVLAAKQVSSPPKGSPPGRAFKRWTPNGYINESTTGTINTRLVYTEAGKDTLVFDDFEILAKPQKIDLRDYHVFFTPEYTLPPQYRGMKLPYRSSMLGTCSGIIPFANPEMWSKKT